MRNKKHIILLVSIPGRAADRADPENYQFYRVDESQIDDDGNVEDGAIEGDDVEEMDGPEVAGALQMAAAAAAKLGADAMGGLPSMPVGTVDRPGQPTIAGDTLARSRQTLDAAGVVPGKLYIWGAVGLNYKEGSYDPEVWFREGDRVIRASGPDGARRVARFDSIRDASIIPFEYRSGVVYGGYN
ncbi:MAG: hypothetical protein E6R08_01330 [Nevskiaceae bacterium]|nr:MAG: hypothetical protein E6R08_01330 [Nevskiaceae bacterium]